MVDVLKKSIWVFHLNSGSCNGCDIEVLDVFTPRPDFERFGVKLVPSPRHADAIALTGPITRAMVPNTLTADHVMDVTLRFSTCLLQDLTLRDLALS